MKIPTTNLLILLHISAILTQASFIPASISDATSELKDHAWRKKNRKPQKHVELDSYPKYFHEPDGSQVLHHYDSRYHKDTLGFDDKTSTQIHLIRSYLEFFRKNQMETWIAHGTLLGWWWNQKLLPWDWDIDTQVSIGTMLYLAENYNSTRYSYTSETDTEFDPATSKQVPISRKYHLDVNPAVYTRHRSEGANIIDARWIDVRNGLYIDMTAVAETYPDESPGVWFCKNYHHYGTRDLWPMRESTFEGVVAKIPYAYTRILGQEYGSKALSVDEYQDHLWRPLDHVWTKKTAKEKDEYNSRKDSRRKKQEAQAERMKEQHEKEKGKIFDHDQQVQVKEQKERASQQKNGKKGQ